MKTVAVIAARTASKRLHNKVLLPLKGKPLLERLIERVKASTLISSIVVATSRLPEDDAIREICSSLDVSCYSGHDSDLLDRHYKAAFNCGADVVVRIPSSCPLIDPTMIDKVLGYYFRNMQLYDYVSNLHPQTHPDGNDIEIFPLDILGMAWVEASRESERNQTTPFIWQQPDRFRIGNYRWETGLDYSLRYRWRIEYQEDYELIRAVFDYLHSDARMFLMEDIIEFLRLRPEIRAINRKTLASISA